MPEYVAMARRVRNPREHALGRGARGATQRHRIHRLVEEIAVAKPQQQSGARTGHDGAMQAVAVATEGGAGRALEASRAITEQLHRHRRDDTVVPARQTLHVDLADAPLAQDRLEPLDGMRSFDIVVCALLRRIDWRQEGEHGERAKILPVAMEELRIGMRLAVRE